VPVVRNERAENGDFHVGPAFGGYEKPAIASPISFTPMMSSRVAMIAALL
jgi:hypothetical protein